MSASRASNNNAAAAMQDATGQHRSGALPVIKAQLQFQLSTLTDESFAKNVTEIDAVSTSSQLTSKELICAKVD